MQVDRSLEREWADAFLRKQSGRRFWRHLEHYLKSMTKGAGRGTRAGTKSQLRRDASNLPQGHLVRVFFSANQKLKNHVTVSEARDSRGGQF